MDRFLVRERNFAVWVFASGAVCICTPDGSECNTHYPAGSPFLCRIRWAAINANGTRMALQNSSALWFIDLKTMAAISRYEIEPVESSGFKSHGDILYTFDPSGRLCAWDFLTGTWRATFVEFGESLSIPWIELSRDGRHLVVCDCYGLILVYDTATGAQLASAAELRRIHSAWMNDGKLIPDTSGGVAYQLRHDLPWEKSRATGA